MTNRVLKRVAGILLPLVGSLFAVGACGGRIAADVVAVRDSAGVSIIEHRGNIWMAQGSWERSAEPVLKIGAVESGESNYLFDRIRSVVVLRNGTIVVANGGTSSLRWFDSTGRFLFERGRGGRGPGEFVFLSNITLGPGDTITAVDEIRRLSLFAPDGSVISTWNFRGVSDPGPAYRLADGSHIVGTGGFGPFDPGRLEAGFHRFQNPLVRLYRETTRVDTLGLFPAREVLVRDRSDRRSFGVHPYSKGLHYIVRGEEVFVGTAERFEINVYDLGGTLRRSIRAPALDLTLDPAVAQADLLGQLRADPEYAGATAAEKQEAESELAERAVPETRPAIEGLLVDYEGNLWVGEHVLKGRPTRWVVFGRDGAVLQSLSLPPRFVLMAVTSSSLIGRGQDDLGVQFVHVYALRK